MQLVELCEPLFQYVCLLNRSARKGSASAPNQVRAEILAILADIRRKSAADPQLSKVFGPTEVVLGYFADSMIRNSSLPFAKQWEDLGAVKGAAKVDGEEKFFDLLDDALRDQTPAGVEQLRVFYNCIGLGFTGWYTGQPDLLRKRMFEISAKIRGVTESVHASRIVPEAYEHVNTNNLIDPPGASLLGIGITVFGLLAVVFAANMYLFTSSSRNLNDSVQRIIQSPDPAPAAPPTTAPSTAPAPAPASSIGPSTEPAATVSTGREP